MKAEFRHKMLVLSLLTALATGCSASVPGSPSSGAPGTQALVTRVIDGDSIEVDIAGERYEVRYIGIDAPEMTDKRAGFRALAQEAAELNRELVDGKTVRLEKDVSETDQYGRLLRYVYVDNIFVNAEVVRQGLAWAKVYEPDTGRQDFLEEMETEAVQAGRGLWE